MQSTLVGVIRYAEALLSPFFYLWPWTIATIVFGAFIQSPQGEVLLRLMEQDPLHWTVSVGGIFVASALIVSSVAMTALIYVWSRHAKGWRDLSIGQRGYLPLGVALALSLFLIPVAIFAFRAGLTAALALLAVFYVGVVLAIPALVGPLLIAPEEPARLLNFVVGNRRKLFMIGTLASVLPIVLGALLVIHAPLQLNKVGPLLLVLLGLYALASFAQGVFVSIPHALGLPFVGVLVAIGLTAIQANAPFRTDGPNPLIEERVTKLRVAAAGDAQCRNLDPHQSVAGRVRPRPRAPIDVSPPNIYLVSSEGGGIRAAYWTAVGLAQLDLGSRSGFAREVASLSGVSGGSLGIATWLAGRELTGVDDTRRLKLVKEFLAGDFLTPMVAGLLFLDAPRLVLNNLWFQTNRGQVFEKALALRWEALTGSDFFFRPIGNLCLRSFEEPPLVYFNATDALTGAYVAIGNSVPPRWRPGEVFAPTRITVAHSGVSVAQAVHISAHFPFLSPADDVSISAEELKRSNTIEHEDGSLGKDNRSIADRARAAREQARGAVLVDGGYYDNTGLTPSEGLLDTLRDNLKGEARRYARLKLVHFENDPERACLPLAEAEWRTSAPEPVLSYIDAAGFVPRCAQEIALLQSATRPRRFEFLSTHLLAIHSVRSAHARERREALTDRLALGEGFRANLLRMDVSSEIDCAFRTKECPQGRLSVLESRQPAEVERRYQQALARADAHFKGNWYGSVGAYGRHRARIEAWRSDMLAIGAATDCAGQKPRSPPLAWTLGAEDQRFLDCLAIRAANVNDFPAAEPPSMRADEAQPLR